MLTISKCALAFAFGIAIGLLLNKAERRALAEENQTIYHAYLSVLRDCGGASWQKERKSERPFDL